MIRAGNDLSCPSGMDPREKRRMKRRKARRKKNPDLAYGFDLEFSSDGSKIITSPGDRGYVMDLYARLGLNCYNFHEGTNLKFLKWEKYSTISRGSEYDHYITLEAMEDHSVLSLQTVVSISGRMVDTSYVIDTWRTYASRLRCNKHVDDVWDEDKAKAILYTGPMPKWLSDDDEPLNIGNKKYYVVQESELHENHWLHLLMEFAFFSKIDKDYLPFPPLEIKKVVVETKEDYITEAREKLKADNAIFYISYKFNGVSTLVASGDHKAIIRKTMDGKPGHMTLEVASPIAQEED